MPVAPGDVGALVEQSVGQRGRGQAERQEPVVADDQVVLLGLHPRVGQVRHRDPGQLADQLGQVAHPVALGDLVEDHRLVARGRRIGQGDLDTPDGVLDVDEGAGLAAGAVHGQRVVDGGLHQEPVEHGAVVAVVVEAVDQPFVAGGLLGLGAPDDALVQVGDPHLVVGRVEGEHQLVEGLGEVVDRAGIGRVQDLALQVALRGGDLDGQVALRDRGRAGPAVAVDAHGAQVHQRRVGPGRDQRGQQVVGGPHVVVDGVALARGGPHRVRRRPLLGEVHDRVRAQPGQQGGQPVALGGQVEPDEADLPAGDLLPDPQPFAEGPDRRERLDLQLQVDRTAAEVVDDGHIVAAVGEVERGGPAAESVAAQYENTHALTPVNRYVYGHDSIGICPGNGTRSGRSRKCPWALRVTIQGPAECRPGAAGP